MRLSVISLLIFIITSCENNEIELFNVSYEVLDITCTSDGEIDVTVTGGVPPYQFLWSNGQITEDLRGLKNENSFNVTIVDNSGKSKMIQDIKVEQTPSIILIEGITGNTGVLLDNGFINLKVSGGVAPYSFVWSNSETSENIADLAPGYYSVEITDINGCLSIAGFWIDGIGEFVDDRDEQVYREVQIGNQVWMYDPLNLFTDEGSSFISDNPDNSEKGRLYTWETIIDSNINSGQIRGLCPESWHIPSLEEYFELESFIKTQRDFDDFDFERYIATPAGIEYRFISMTSGVSWYNGGYTTYITSDSTTFMGSYWHGFGNKGDIFDVWDNTKEPYNIYPWTTVWKEFKHFCHCVKDKG